MKTSFPKFTSIWGVQFNLSADAQFYLAIHEDKRYVVPSDRLADLGLDFGEELADAEWCPGLTSIDLTEDVQVAHIESQFLVIELLAALKMAQAALNTAPRFPVPSLSTDSYRIASVVDAAIAKAESGI